MQFRLGGIPVRLHGSFFLMTVLLGATGGRDPAMVAIWVAVVAVSVLLHEFGHALVGRVFGLAPVIELHGMGGTTSWPSGSKLSYGKRILVSLAGPAVGIAIGLSLFALTLFRGRPEGRLLNHTLDLLVWVNGGWAVLNLIPMLPLDGGSVMAHVFNLVSGGKGDKAARIVSLVVAAGVGLFALSRRYDYGAILCGLFAFQNARVLFASRRLEKDAPLLQVMERAVRELNDGNPREAIAAAEKVAREATGTELRLEALRILAYAFVADGRWAQLLQLLEGGFGRALPDEDFARFESAARGSGSAASADAIAALRAQRAQPASDFHAG